MKNNKTIITEIRIVYLWYYHLNPDVNTKEIETAIKNHDWKTFEKWLKWQETQKLEYFPSYASVFINSNYIGELLINEQTFKQITDNDYECG